MELDIKLMLGHLLGQLLRLQEMVKPGSSGMDEATRYKLIMGFEDEVEQHFGRTALYVSRESCAKSAAILSKIWRDPQLREGVNQFMVKDRLRRAGIKEGDDHIILTALRLEDRFADVFERIDPDLKHYQPSEFEI